MPSLQRPSTKVRGAQDGGPARPEREQVLSARRPRRRKERSKLSKAKRGRRGTHILAV